MGKKQVDIEEFNKIEFKATSNVIINFGILSLDDYLSKRKEELENLISCQYSHCLESDKLTIECEKLIELLEQVYYIMGEELYNTSTKKQIEEADKFYFVEKDGKLEAEKFAKMFTFGLAGIFNNNSAGKAHPLGTSKRIKELENNKNYFDYIVQVYGENNLKLNNYKIIKKEENTNNAEYYAVPDNSIKGDSNIYFNHTYIKVPKLEFKKELFLEGDKICCLINEPFSELTGPSCSSPFISGISTFNSFLNDIDRGVSFKAKYISIFSPKFAYYYQNDEYVHSYFITSGDLLRTKKYLKSLSFKDETTFKENPFSNFDISYNKDYYILNDEIAFIITYNFFKKHFQTIFSTNQKDATEDDFLKEIENETKTMNLTSISFRKFSKTYRTNSFNQYDHLKTLFQLFYLIEIKNNIMIDRFVQNLLFIKPNTKRNLKKSELERTFRNKILGLILELKPIVKQIEDLFVKSFIFLSANNEESLKFQFKDYKIIYNFFITYQKLLLEGGNNMITESLQQKSINLGTSIGQSILRFSNSLNEEGKIDKTIAKENAKSSRSYIISLHKARTLEQFNEAIIRIQTKYLVSISREILEEINDSNFELVKQFTIISALNQLNQYLSNYNSKGAADETAKN